MEFKTIPEIKSRTIAKGGKPDPKTIAWMKELRENNKTKKIYEINPYVEVYQFRDNMYGFLQHNLDGSETMWMHFVIGPEKAFLVDTGYGLGDTKALCDMLSGGKEIIVVNTHPHCDHAYGNCRFDKVYVHEYAYADTIKHKSPRIWDYLFDENGNNIYVDFDRNDLPVYKDHEVVGVPNHYTWDLGGGYEIELIHLPGHHKGQAGFLDKHNRIFFAGDGILSQSVGITGTIGRVDPRDEFHGGLYDQNDPTTKFGTITEYRNALLHLQSRLDEFDYVFGGHHMGDVESWVVNAYVDATTAIVEHPDKYDEIMPANHKTGKGPKMIKYVKGYGIIIYGEDGI